MNVSKIRKRFAISIALLVGAVMFTSSASAEVFDIKYEVNFSEYGNFITEFSIDTGVEGAIERYFPTFDRFLYGYQRSAIAGLSVFIDGYTLDQKDLVNLSEAGYAADVWFDAPLNHGATPKTWMYLSNDMISLEFGGAICGEPCLFLDGAFYNTHSDNVFDTGVLQVTVNSNFDAIAEQVCGIALGGVVNENGNCVVTTTELTPYTAILRAAGKSGKGWTEMGEDTTNTVRMYDRSGAGWGDTPYFDESETVREIKACYNPDGKNMGTKGQCGK